MSHRILLPRDTTQRTENAFATAGINNTPLHALANGVDGSNGVYLYSSSGAFPNTGWNSTNYWVDVVFAAGNPPASNPQLTLSASSLAFGNVTVNTASTKTVTLTSERHYSELTVNSATLTGAGFTVPGATFPLNVQRWSSRQR